MIKVVRITLGSLGALLLLLSLPFVGMALWELFNPPEDVTRGVSVALLFLFSGTAYVGWLLVKRNFWVSKQKLEQRILELAHAQDGTLTVYDVALLPDVSTKTAKTTLDALVQEGLATSYVNTEGTMLYLFGNRPLPEDI
jgi:hypothetical protein